LQKIRVTGAQYRVPKKTYIRASGYNHPAFRVIHGRLKSNPSWRTYEMPCGHDAMIDMPERLAEILAEAPPCPSSKPGSDAPGRPALPCRPPLSVHGGHCRRAPGARGSVNHNVF
jgi:hypothetical protein